MSGGFSWRRAVGWLLGVILLLWRATLRIRRFDDKRNGPGAHIYAIWHAEQLASILINDEKKMASMASRSKDGDFIAGVLDVLGIHAARGSSSRGGAAAMLELEDAVANGYACAITVDGPRGPLHSVKYGVLRLALHQNKPIVPAVCTPTRVWRARSWDKFEVPLPFSRIDVRFGESMTVRPEDSLDAKAEELKMRLQALAPSAASL